MITFKNELEKVEEYLERDNLSSADNLLTKIKREYETIKSLKKISAGTSKTKQEIMSEIDEFKKRLKEEDAYEGDLTFKLGLFEYYANMQTMKEMLEARIKRVKEYLDIR